MDPMTAIDTTEAREKLRNLGQHIPDADETLIEFGKLLADCLKGKLAPLGFPMKCEQLIYDLQEGIDGFTGEPIHSWLVGYPPAIYAMLRMRFDDIASAIFPEDFATETKKVWAKIARRT